MPHFLSKVSVPEGSFLPHAGALAIRHYPHVLRRVLTKYTTPIFLIIHAMPLPLLEEARSLQDDEAMLLECVYGGAGNGDGGDEGGSSDSDFRIIRSVDDGRPQRVECVVMRECPTAVIFSAAERRRYTNGGGELPPLRHGATAADIVWAAPTNSGEEASATEELSSSRGGGGAASSQSVPVGYKCQRPLRVTLTLTIPPAVPLRPFAALAP